MVSLDKILVKMDRFQSHQIVQVILRVKYGVATDEEKRVFEDWIKAGEEHQALMTRWLR